MKGPFYYFGWGRGIDSAHPWASPCGRLRRPGSLPAIRSNPGFSSPSPANKKGRLSTAFLIWLGDKDSNLGWRSQSPQSYR